MPSSSGTCGSYPSSFARLRHVGDVVRHLTEQRRRDRDLGLDAELLGDHLRGVQKTVALAVGEVDRAARDATFGERLECRA